MQATMGAIDFDGRYWCAPEMLPHVAIRFKHMFKGLGDAAVPPFVIKDRFDLPIDLDWFMQRYPLRMTDRAKTRVAQGLEAYAAQRATLGLLSKPDYTPTLNPGFKEGETPFPYQVRAAEMLRATGRLLLLDDVGLGKTVSALASLSDGWGLPAAVVVQPHLSSQWVKQYIERFTHLKAFEVKDRNVRDLPPADIYLFRYSNIGAWGTYAETLKCKTVVLDEVQELRHGRGTDKGMGTAAFCAAADTVLGLTATPIYNYGSEIFNVVEFIAPGALGGWNEFLINWCISHGSHWIVKDPGALGAYLQSEGITLRRTNEDTEVASTLPPASKVVIEVGWNEGDVQSDHELQRTLAMRVLQGGYFERGDAARQLDLMMRHDTGMAKARSVAAYVRTLVEAGEHVVLAGWHREVYQVWNKSLGDLNPVMFTGSETQPAKARSKAAFVSGESRLMFMSLRSGAGLDGLQAVCSHVVFGEFDWSPQVHAQVTGRLQRYGQSRPVTSHFLHVDGGSDPVLMATLGLKSSQAHGILNPYGGDVNATPVDETRMRQLARAVLGIKEKEGAKP
jgi:hypothetical protein